MLFDSIKATTWNNITCIYNNIKYKILYWILVGFSKQQHLCLSLFLHCSYQQLTWCSILCNNFSWNFCSVFFLFNFLLRCMFMQATLVLYYVYLKFFTISLFCLSVCVFAILFSLLELLVILFFFLCNTNIKTITIHLILK